MIARRKGLPASEFAKVMDVTTGAIRAAIRRGKLPGVRLRCSGGVYAYPATVDDVAAYYDLAADATAFLREHPQHDATGFAAWMGVPSLDQSNSIEVRKELDQA